MRLGERGGRMGMERGGTDRQGRIPSQDGKEGKTRTALPLPEAPSLGCISGLAEAEFCLARSAAEKLRSGAVGRGKDRLGGGRACRYAAAIGPRRVAHGMLQPTPRTHRHVLLFVGGGPGRWASSGS